MDPRSMAAAASSLRLLCSNIAKAITNITENYNAAPATSSIRAECLAITASLTDIQSLLNQPHALSSRVIPQIQLEEAFKNAQNGCNYTLLKLEEEAGKCTANQTTVGRSPHTTYLGDEILIKGHLKQIQRHLTDIKLLITAVKRNNISEIQQLLRNDTFIGDLIDISDPTDPPTPSTTGEYSQALWEEYDLDSKSIYTQASTNVPGFSPRSGYSQPYSPVDADAASMVSKSGVSLRSGYSKPYGPLDGDAVSVLSNSSLGRPQSVLSNRSQNAARAQMGSVWVKLFKSNTDLHRAAKKGDTKKIRSLLAAGVDINYDGSSGCTALHIATDCGHESVVRVLLDNGADPTAKSIEGRTPLHSAARTGHTAVVRLLLEKGADIKSRDPSGSTALHIAAYNGHESVVQILLEKYPFVEGRGPSGFTALHVAAFNGKSAVVRLLVEMGADIEARSDTGRTSLQLAAEKGHEAVVRHLLQHGANVMAKDRAGRTALQGAVSNQHGVVAQLLLEKVVPETPSQWQLQRGLGSGPTFELAAAEPVDPDSKMPELDATESSTWPRRVSNTTACTPDSSVIVELPAYEVNRVQMSPTSITRRSLTNRRRPGGT